MRNGNYKNSSIPLVLVNLFILPMRNGNRLKMQKLEKKILLFILPMRNGEGSKGMEDEVKNVNGKIKM